MAGTGGQHCYVGDPGGSYHIVELYTFLFACAAYLSYKSCKGHVVQQGLKSMLITRKYTYLRKNRVQIRKLRS